MRALVVASLCCLMPIVGFVACKDDRCEAGFVKTENNICVPLAADAGADGGAEAGASPSDAGDASDGGVSGNPFGRACTHSGEASPDCAPPAGYCAMQPGSDTGYCTAINCKADPSICPADWSCFDVGVVNFCFKP